MTKNIFPHIPGWRTIFNRPTPLPMGNTCSSINSPSRSTDGNGDGNGLVATLDLRAPGR